MGSVNKVILVGNLGADPELKYTPSSRPLCNLRIATTEVFKDKSGQRQEKTEWHRVTVWGDQAENCPSTWRRGARCTSRGDFRPGPTTRTDRSTTPPTWSPTGWCFSAAGAAALAVAAVAAKADGQLAAAPRDSGPPDDDSNLPVVAPASDDDIPF